MIECRVLGPVELVVDGESAPPELLWRKNLALLVYLARSPNRTRARDHLIGLLWGDKAESLARQSLNEALRVLRKSLGKEGLETEGAQVRLSNELVRLDVDEFERRVAASEWREATALVAGEFMEGFSVPGCSQLEDWLSAERFTFRDASVNALLARVDELLLSGETAEAAATARRANALDPLSEAAARAAMRSLAIAGDRVGALSVYEALHARLGQELGLEADEETRDLAERVRRERSWKLPELLMPGTGSESETRRGPLVDRKAELQQLLDEWTSCRRRRRATLGLIEGDPGMGKSRLAEEVLARARLDGALTLTARAVEADRDEAWSGVLALARDVPLDAPDLGQAPGSALRALAGRLAEWGERFGPASDKDEEPSVGHAFSEVLRTLSGSHPILVFLDDAQWLDRESLLAVELLLRDLAGAPLFVLLAAARYPERVELEELRVRIGRDLAGVSVGLRPLSRSALRELARRILPSYDDPDLDRVARRIATDSAGVPLLAVELLHAVALGLDLSTTTGAWPEPFRTLDQTLPGDLPDAVVAAVRVGFRRLSKDAQAVLAAAAVLEERVDVTTLGRATGLDSRALETALDELEWRRWLGAESRGYSFVARVVRDVVARDMLTAGQRRRILEAARQS